MLRDQVRVAKPAPACARVAPLSLVLLIDSVPHHTIESTCNVYIEDVAAVHRHRGRGGGALFAMGGLGLLCWSLSLAIPLSIDFFSKGESDMHGISTKETSLQFYCPSSSRGSITQLYRITNCEMENGMQLLKKLLTSVDLSCTLLNGIYIFST